MRRRTLIWIGFALLLAVGAAAGYAVAAKWAANKH